MKKNAIFVDFLNLFDRIERMSAKAELVSYLETLPDELTTADLLYETYFFHGVKSGLNDIENEKTQSHDEVVRRHEAWRKSRGLTSP